MGGGRKGNGGEVLGERGKNVWGGKKILGEGGRKKVLGEMEKGKVYGDGGGEKGRF